MDKDTERKSLERDAKRWRTLLASKRIRILGTAGIGSKEYQHFGVEFYSFFSEKVAEGNYGKWVITNYVDTIIGDND